LSNTDTDITVLQSRIDAARIAKARSEATTETAQATLDAAMLKLKNDFGVDNVEDARAKLMELQTNLQTRIDQIVAILDTMDI